MEISPGSRIGAYETVSRIGAGGMGEVFRARDSRIGRDVAIKVLHADVSENAERLQRFEQEARAAGSLNHPNLVTIHEFGSHDSAPFIVMELLEGETLRARIEEHAGSGLPLRKAVDYAVQIANGLAAAHDRGIVHRDLKPENIFVTRDGRVKILDFGLAKLRARSGSDLTEGATQARGTEPGTVMGTAGYMSPEQVRGQDVDHRTDIFAFGAILYEMLSGRRAFHGPSAVETMNSILRDDPPDLQIEHSKVPPSIERLVRRCLEKNPEERFHSAHDVAYALDLVSTTSASHAQPAIAVRPRRWGRLALLATAGLLCAAIGFGIARAMRPASQTSRVVPQLTHLTFESGVETQPSVAPDGKSFVYVLERSGNRDLYSQRVGGTNAINLTKDSPADDYAPAFSPDGQLIAFRSERAGGGIFVMGATGESVRRLTDFGFDPAWSPDGKTVVVTTERLVDPSSRQTSSALWLVDAESGARRELPGTGDAMQPNWSPNNKRIAYWGVASGRRLISTIPANGGTSVPILGDWSFNWNPVWAADGNSLIFVSDRTGMMNLWRVPIDEQSGRVTGEPEPLTLSSQSNGYVSVARNRQAILFSSSHGRGRPYTVPFDPQKLEVSGVPVEALPGSREIFAIEPSPDGQWLAFSTVGREDLFVARRDGSEIRQLTNDAFRDRIPRWSPDGSRLAFYSNRGGDYSVWTIRADGSNLQQITGGTLQLLEVFWSPDGKRLSAYDNRAQRGYVFDAVPGAPLTPFPKGTADLAFRPLAWAPSGSRIAGAFVDREGQARQMATIDPQTGRYAEVAKIAGIVRAEWIDERYLLMSVFGESRIFTIDTRNGQIREAGLLPDNGTLPRLARDRKSIFYRSSATEADIWMLTLPEENPATGAR